MRTFHNTINESGSQLLNSEAKARSQQERILAFFRDYPYQYFTPFDIHKKVLPYAPITSVRRAITNLQKAGHLDKTGYMVLGDLGKNNHCWRLKNEKQEQLGLF
jgi:hypothetical protein